MSAFSKFHKSLYIKPRIYIGVVAVVVCYFIAFYIPVVSYLGDLIAIVFLAAVIADIFLLFIRKKGVTAKRNCNDRLSLGDINVIHIDLESFYPYPVDVELIDELPYQLETRDFKLDVNLGSKERKSISYDILPYTRGVYEFGAVIVFISNKFLGFFQRKIEVHSEKEIAVYPSVIQMENMELLAFAKLQVSNGIKKIRRIGHSYEFDQISEYVPGDDYRSVNWKATGRTGTLMVNRYQDERSQPVYCLVDASRNMKMPFNGLSLLDYAINSTLVISNISLKKNDKAGLITFSEKINTVLKAQNSVSQLRKILHNLYNLSQSALESDFEKLFFALSKTASVRGLVFLFTNFETVHALNRIKHVLNRINKQHLLVVIFFENTEISTFAKKKARDLEEVYQQTISENYLYQKQLMVRELNALKIQTILTKPEDLSINVINKYLELKARGLI